MAWDAKYYVEWTDILGLDWRVDIEKDGSFTAAEIKATGDPLNIEFLANSDDLFEGLIKGSVANIRIYSATNFQWHELFAVEDMEFRMSIYYNDGSDHLFWRGFLITNNYQEPYDGDVYSVVVSASDGLGILKTMLYKYQTTDPDDTYYDGRLLESEIINDILAKIGITGFTEYVNLYEESMTATAGYSPFDQIRIDVDVFRDMYCYEVLEAILMKYNAVMRIVAGVAIIYRPLELVETTVYGRTFADDNTKSAVTYTAAQYINRTINTSDLIDQQGGTLMIQSPAKKIYLHQDYGNKPSWIENWKFASDRWSGGGIAVYDADGWTRYGIGAAEIYPIGVGQPSQSDGVALVGVNTYPTLNHYIYQIFGTYTIISASDTMCFQFDYQWFNRSAAPLTFIFYFRVETYAGAYSLEETDDSYADWVTPAVNLSITEADVPDGDSGWKTYKRLFTGMDVAGSYKVTFYSPSDAATLLVGIKDVMFLASNDTITSKKITEFKSYGLFPSKSIFGTTYKLGINWTKKSTKIILQDNEAVVEHLWEKANAINGIEKEFGVILGDVTKSSTGGTGIDNILEQFSGSLATSIRTLLQVVHTVTLTADSPDGTANITCDELTKLATYTTDLAGTAAAFVTSHNAAYAAIGITVTNSGADIIFTGTAGQAFTGDTTIVNASGGLDGTVGLTQPDTYSDAIAYSTDWNTFFKGGHTTGSESKELLSIIVDELAEQYSRPKQFISLPLIENDSTGKTPHVNILGNFKDELNTVGGNNRIFVFNKGNFNVKDREWELDLIEII